MSGQLHSPVAVPGGGMLYLLTRRLGGPESQSAHCREDIFSCLCRKSNSRSSSPYCHL